MKNSLKYIFFLFLFLLMLFCAFYGRFGIFFSDTPREVYIVQAMNDGNVLYKDIFNVYFPFAYQLNYFFSLILGNNLRTFYIAGFINSVLFIFGLFFIGNLFLEKDKKLSFIYCLFVSVSCIYAVSQSNYIFPYSYSIIYALSAIIWSLYFLLLNIKKQNNKYLIISSFLFGLSISCKYEFLLFGIILSIVFFDKKINMKTKISSFIAFLIVPLISLFLLLFKGCNIQDLYLSFNYILALAKSKYAAICYKSMGIIPSFYSLKLILINLIKHLSVLVISCLVFIKANKFFTVLFCIIAICLLAFFNQNNSNYFDGIGIFLIIEFILINVYFYTKKKNNTFNINDKMFFILFLSSILISTKSIFCLNLNNYGAYFVPIVLFCILSSVYYYMQEIFSINVKNSIFIVFTILFFSYFVSNIEKRYFYFESPVKTEKGIIYVSKYVEEAVNNTINYIKENTEEKDKILIIPEGATINYLTNRKSDNKYYYLIPPNIEIFNEDKIVKDLENNLPEYIITQPMTLDAFRETYFCGSYGKKICALLPAYYEKPTVFGSKFKMYIYKKAV